MEKGKITLTQKDAENTPAGGVVVGKRDGQTMIYDDASLGGYFVGKLHKDGGIKMVNKSTGQPLEVQGAEVIITAPAVNDQTKREFEGKMMTNREILSKINSDGGGVSFADGGDIPAKIHTTDKEYEFGGKMVHDTDIAHSLGMNSTLKKGKQQFSSGNLTYDVDGIYNAIKKGKLRLKTKEVETFPMKYPVYDKKYSETVKADFRKPNGITVRTESGEEVLIDGNHRMNNAYLNGRKTIKTYYIEDPKQIAKFTKKNKFELGGENKVGGHLSKGKSLKQIAEMHNVSLAHINEELAKGLEVEKEHFADFKERTRVAKDHLVENPNYYTILEKAGLKNGGGVDNDEKNVLKVEVTLYRLGINKEIAHNLEELHSIFKKFYTKVEILLSYDDILIFVTPIGKNDKLFKETSIRIGNGIKEINPFTVSKEKLGKTLKGNYGGLDWSYFFNKSKKYSEGGSVSKENEFAFNKKSKRLKSFYKTNNPSIDSLLMECQPFINELVEQQKKLVLKLTLNTNGVETPMSEFAIEQYEIGLIFKMVQSFNKYLKTTDILTDVTIKNVGLFEISATVIRDGKNYTFITELIPAGGYNIQEFHYRYITKTDLPESKENSAIDDLKSKLSVFKKIKSLEEDINRKINSISNLEKYIKQGYYGDDNNDELYRVNLNKQAILDEQENIERYKKEIEKLKIKQNDLESVLISSDKLKDGGHILSHHRHSDNLVKDAKSGNTPARDLNNYNDIMDLEADGMVGMESGLAFADGGNINSGIQVGDLFVMDLPDIWRNQDYGKKRQVAIVTNVDNPEKVLIYNGVVYFNIKETSLLSKKKSSISEVLNEFRNKNDMSVSQRLFSVINEELIKESIDLKTIDLLKERYPNRNIIKTENNSIKITPNFLSTKQTWISKVLGYYLIHNVSNEDSYYVFDSLEDAIDLKYGQPIYANGGITPYDANLDGDSVDVIENEFAKGGLVTKENLKSIEKEFLALTDNSHYKGIYDEDEIDYGVALEWGKYGYSVSEEQQSEDYQMLINASAKFNAKNIGKLYANAEFGDKYNTVTILDYDMLANDSQLVSLLPEKYFAKLKVGRGNNSNVVERLELEVKKSKDLEAVSAISKKIGVTEEKAKNIVSLLDSNKKQYDRYKNIKTSRFDIVGSFNSANFPKKTFENAEQTLNYIQTDDFANSVYMSTGYGKPISEGNVTLYNSQVLKIKYNEDSRPYKPDGSTDWNNRGRTLDMYPYLAVNVSGKEDFMTSFKKGVSDFVACYKYYVLGADNKKKIEEAEDLSDLLEMVESGNYANGGITPYDANLDGDSVDVIENEFAKGGVVYDKTKPKIEKVTIKETRFNRASVMGRNASTVSELQQIVSDYIGNSPKEDVDWIKFYVNDSTRGSYYIDLNKGKKNTVKNVNPETLNSLNFRRVIDAKDYLVKNYDWTDFFELGSKTSNSPKVLNRADFEYIKIKIGGNKDLALKVVKKLEEIGFTDTQQINEMLSEDGLPFSIITLWNYVGTLDNEYYFNKDKNKEIFPEDLGIDVTTLGVAPITSNSSTLAKTYELDNVQVSWNNNLETYYSGKELIEALRNIERENNGQNVVYEVIGYDYNKSGGVPVEVETDDTSFVRRNYSDQEIKSKIDEWLDGFDTDKFFNSGSQNTYSVEPFDLKNTKIWIGDDVELRDKVIDKLIEIGIPIDSSIGNRNRSQDVFIYIYDKDFVVWSGVKTENFDKNSDKEIFPSDLGIKVASQTTAQYKPIDLSNTKIWIGDDEDVNRQIQEKAFELGWGWGNSIRKEVTQTGSSAMFFESNKEIEVSYNRSTFDNETGYREITFKDLFDKIEPASSAQMPTMSGSLGSVQEIKDLKEAVSVLEGIASQASQKYNTNKYEESLELLKEVKEEYSLALSFTPESSFMYERIELMKNIAEIQKEITTITELKNGGAYYILSKVIDRLERGENWKELGNGEIMVNEVPQQEIDTIIYTEKFKNWFGDWEQALITKEYDYVSKAITKNGKPCVMYHGAKRIKYSYRQVSNGVVYLAENRSYAEWFSANESPYQKQGDYLTQCFVNLKNPIDLTPFGVEEVDLRDIIQYIDALYPLAKIYDVLPPNVAMAIMNNELIGRNFRAWYVIRQFPELNKHIRDNTTYDGFIYYENNPSDMIINESGEMVENITKATAVFNSNQVKLVDAMLFDGSLDDWRFETGGKVN